MLDFSNQHERVSVGVLFTCWVSLVLDAGLIPAAHTLRDPQHVGRCAIVSLCQPISLKKRFLGQYIPADRLNIPLMGGKGARWLL